MPVAHDLHPGTQAGSSSRKRSHAEITRSESRSITPHLPFKRRRISQSSSPSITHDSPPPQWSHRRTERDGFDYRRPIMATTNMHQSNTIDLTADDDSPPPASVMTTLAPRRQPSHPIRSASPTVAGGRHTRAPPFGGSQPLEVINLSDDDEPDPRRHTQPVFVTASLQASPTPEVEFVGERPARANLSNQNRVGDHRSARRLPTPPPAEHGGGALGGIPEFIRRNTQFLFGFNAAADRARGTFDDLAMDRIDGLQDPIRLGPRRGSPDPTLEIVDDYDGVHLDYRQPAFALGNRSSETPQAVQEPYKGPPPAKEGFTRNYGEESILVCPWCNEELSAGNGDVAQQVWVIKQCGHVYCGSCAASRVISRGGNKKDSKRVANRKTSPFKTCNVDGCSKPVTSKTSMFPIYL